ncbi:single-stranded DNA-binding protein [Planctomycetota bacterium]|nr:single-stranded DNA-binding protein [Planctomycetota bacterium]
MNIVAIIGNITKQPEIQKTKGGKEYTEFGIAVNETWKDKNGSKQEAVSFFNIVSWGKQAGIICKHFEKGQQIHVTGKLRQERWEKNGQKHYRVNIIMNDFGFGQRPKNSTKGKNAEPAADSNPREQFDDNAGGSTTEGQF